MIHCQDTAFKNYMNLLFRKGIKTIPVQEYNHGRHRLVRASNGELLYLVFKRDFYNTFSKEFPELVLNYPSFNDVGESINQESLHLCLSKGVTKIVFLHPKGNYVAYPHQIKAFCEKNNLIRTQDITNTYKGLGGYLDVKKEITYSFPKGLLQEE